MAPAPAPRADAPMPASHLLLALAVVGVWGTNFPIIRIGLQVMPPLWMATMRFVLVVLPAIVFLRRPPVPWRQLAVYGVAIGAGQFGLLFLAMRGQISPGLASLVVQTQVFFTIGFVVLKDGERPARTTLLALGLAVAGLGIIAVRGGASATPLGIAMVLGAAASWAVGNMAARGAGRVNMLAYVVWGSVFSVPPLLAMALLVEGPASLVHAVQAATPAIWAAVVWQAVGNSLFGYAAWGWLLARHPAGTVTPLALAVPIFGMTSSAWWLGEPLPPWKVAAAGLVIAGLAVNVFGPRVLRGRAGMHAAPTRSASGR